MPNFSIATDIGGTFTDLVLLGDDGRAWSHKVLTTHEDPIKAIEAGTREILAKAELRPEVVNDLVAHATTLVTNCVIERKGASTALITTAGFEDLLVIRNEARPNIFDNQQEFGAPLIPPERTVGVPERIRADGQVSKPFDEGAARERIGSLAGQGIAAVAVCLMNAYANPEHERRVRELVHELLPGAAVSLSSEVAPQIREYLRCSTTAINAYAIPEVGPYLHRLEETLRANGFAKAPLVMLSSGGVIGAATAARFPVRMIESGPAAGALAASHLARLLGRPRLLAFDVGGTTAKACFIENGEPLITGRFEVDRQYLFEEGTGMPILANCIDLIEIGTGGGSIAHRDEVGLLAVGPESAGSEPGPVCYGRGGTQPTVTDADLVLGLVNARAFLGGSMALDLEGAHAALAALGRSLGLDPGRAALGVYETVAEYMAAAIRSHAADRGLDWRGLSMLAFGGAGPLHACYVGELLQADEVIFPPLASVLSAFGSLVTPVAIDVARGYLCELAAVDWARVERLYREMVEEVVAALRQAGCSEQDARLEASLDMRYKGQQYELTVGVALDRLRAQDEEAVRRAFEAAYHQSYAVILADNPIEVVTWRLRGGGPERGSARLRVESAGAKPAAASRSVRFPAGWFDTPVYARAELEPGRGYPGPVLVEEIDTTIVILPGWSVAKDEFGCLTARPMDRSAKAPSGSAEAIG